MMQVVKTPRFDRLLAKARSLRIEWANMTDEMRKEATILASGPYTERDLREMDHPYARRHGQPLLPLLPININRGRLLRSMRVFRRRYGGIQSWQLQYTAPHSKFVLAPEGTEKMFARGYWQAMRKAYEEHIERALRRVSNHGNA